jgi:RNA polymerase sigma-70 factor (ECF subfamily)
MYLTYCNRKVINPYIDCMDTSLRRKHVRFMDLLEPVRTGLGQFARSLTRDRESARDLAAEAIRIAYEQFDTLRDEGKFKSYLYTTLSHLAQRASWRERNRVAFDEVKAANIQSNGASPDTGPDIEALYQALAQLPEEMREAVVLFEISGLSLNEVCDVQHASLSAVKSRISRGRKQLAEILRVDEVSNENEFPQVVATPITVRETRNVAREMKPAAAFYRQSK